jgi:hypothetical protein
MPIRGYFGEGQVGTPLPVSALPGAGFVICPLVWQDGSQGDCGIAMIYRLAYERTQAALRPSWYERLYWAAPN